MKKILVPCDFSDPAIEAFKFAVTIAAKSKGVITLLHVIELPVIYDSTAVMAFEQTYMDDRRKEVEADFAALKKKWVKDQQVKVNGVVAFGTVVALIRRAIKETESDLVVLGTHGASGVKDFTIGSNTEKIVRSSPVPVISLKKELTSVKNIVLPTPPDFSLEQLTMEVKALQAFFGANLHVLFINTPARFRTDAQTKQLMKDFAKRFILKNFTVNVFNDITEEEGIRNFSAQVKADMIAMRTHGRRGIAHVAMGSIAEDVVNHIDCAIWTHVIK